MKNDSNKQMLFEMMHKVGGMKMNEDVTDQVNPEQQKAQTEFYKKLRDIIDYYVIGYGAPSDKPPLISEEFAVETLTGLIEYFKEQNDSPNYSDEIHGY